jgi:iron complex transport system permease protein
MSGIAPFSGRERLRIFWTALGLALFFSLAAALSLGSVRISPGEIPGILWRGLLGEDPVSPEEFIILRLRLPRALAALLVGGALAAAGTLFQGLFRNPLVEPYTLGVSGGATVLIGLGVLLFGDGAFAFAPLLGFLGALLAVSLACAWAGRAGNLGVERLILIGVMISFICSALLIGLVAGAGLDRFRSLLYWTMGSLAGTDLRSLKLLSVVVAAAFGLALTRAWPLNALALGEETAAGLGFDLEREKRLIVLIGSILAGMAVSLAGVVGFVGLLVPHLLRRLVGRDHRVLLPASLAGGALFLLFCDTLARVAFSSRGIQFPVGAMTGLIGGAAFLVILVRGRME